MENNSNDGMRIAVHTILAITILSIFIGFMNRGKIIAYFVGQQADTITYNETNSKYTKYDNTTVDGSDVLNAISEFASTQLTITVQTTANPSGITYNSYNGYAITDVNNINYIEPTAQFSSKLVKTENGTTSSIIFLEGSGTFSYTGSSSSSTTYSNVLFDIVNSNGIPKIVLESSMPLNKDYIVQTSSGTYTISSSSIASDGTVVSIPNSMVSSTQMAFANTPTILSSAKSVANTIGSGDTSPEFTLVSVNSDDSQMQSTNYYKVNFTARDLDVGDTVKVCYEIFDSNGNPYPGYSSEYTMLDDSKSANYSFTSTGNTVTGEGYIVTPTEPFKVEIYALDNSGTKSQIAEFTVNS